MNVPPDDMLAHMSPNFERLCAQWSSGGRARRPYADGVSPDDDDDWVGTPPEGRYSRDRAKPDFWWRQRPVSLAAAGLAVVVVVVILIVALH